jgi:hypothetical protein
MEMISQERIVIDGIENDSQTTYVTSIHVNNTGSITTQLAALYIDDVLISEPMITLNPKDTVWIALPANTPFKPLTTITVATERGVKSIVRENEFLNSQLPYSPNQDNYYGPLKLEYEDFFYGTYSGNNIDSNGWINGWSVAGGKTIVWQITVTNIDDRAVALNKYSCFTLVPNKQANQVPWYIEKIYHPANSADTSFKISSKETVQITYRYTVPNGNEQGTPNGSAGQYRVLLTFFGTFTELDNTIKPYGQSIPFEAVQIT